MICVCKSIKTTTLVQACSSSAMLEQHCSSRSTRSSRLARLARQSRTCRVESSQVEFGLIRNSEEWLGRWYEAVPPVTFSDVLLPHRHTGRLHWGKAESIVLVYNMQSSKSNTQMEYNFVISRMGQVTAGAEAQFCLSFQRCVHRHSCWCQAKPACQ